VAEIPTGDLSWINEAAERLERAWKKGSWPLIEDFLANEQEPRRPPLLVELLRVECELRALAGETPTADEYRRRFPEHDHVVDSVFAPAPTASAGLSQSPSGHARTSATGDRPSALPVDLANHPDYEIVRELGHGGMGIVFLAHNRIMGFDEVLKVIGPDIIERAGVFDRFLREIRAVARLQHPNIVAAHSAFRCGESLVFAMEYVEGLDLARMIKAKGPVPVGHACNFVHQAALGLQHAHEAGMVHRDIKPGNLMLTHKVGKPLIKVLDFGLAKAGSEQKDQGAVSNVTNRAISGAGGLTFAGQMLGTPEYIAPEQIVDAQAADIRADIYSLGCTLYYLLSGRPPFRGTTLHDILQAHHMTDAQMLNLVRPEVPAELAAVAAKMMAKEPGRRFQTPAEMADALAPFFKKGHAAARGANPGISMTGQAEGKHGLAYAVSVPPRPSSVRERASASERPAEPTGPGPSWETLIKISETDYDQVDASAVSHSTRDRPRWLRHAFAGAAGLTVVLTGVVLVVVTNHDHRAKDSTAPLAKTGTSIKKNRREGTDNKAGPNGPVISTDGDQPMVADGLAVARPIVRPPPADNAVARKAFANVPTPISATPLGDIPGPVGAIGPKPLLSVVKSQRWDWIHDASLPAFNSWVEGVRTRGYRPVFVNGHDLASRIRLENDDVPGEVRIAAIAAKDGRNPR
jgi:serine/threonine protein kinase